MAGAIDFDIGIATFSEYDADGFLGVRPDVYGEEKSGAPAFEVHSPYGFVSRPLDPDTDGAGGPTKGCNVLYGWEGSNGHAWLGGDCRVTGMLPQCKPGESFMYGPKGQFARMHLDGSISLYTTDDGTVDGRALFFKLTPTKGLEISLPWGRLTFGPNGFHVTHTSGARLDLGAVGGVPAPLDALASYAKLAAAMVTIQGSAVAIGTDAGAVNLAATTALMTFLTSLVTAIGTITTVSPGASAMGTITPLLPALAIQLSNIGKVV